MPPSPTGTVAALLAAFASIRSFGGSVPHTREPRLHVLCSEARLLPEFDALGLRRTGYEGPGSFASYLLTRAPAAGPWPAGPRRKPQSLHPEKQSKSTVSSSFYHAPARNLRTPTYRRADSGTAMQAQCFARVASRAIIQSLNTDD